MTARAALRWPRHPRAIGAADQLADCGHETNHPPASKYSANCYLGVCLPPARAVFDDIWEYGERIIVGPLVLWRDQLSGQSLRGNTLAKWKNYRRGPRLLM